MSKKTLNLDFHFEDLKKLTIPGILGQYSGFKVTTIVASKGKESYNLLTVIAAVEEDVKPIDRHNYKHINSKINEGWRYMISEHFIALGSLEQVLSDALNIHRWKDNGAFLLFGNLHYCGHWYIPPYLHTSGKGSPISKIVSNNGKIGAHVWEWGTAGHGVFVDFFEKPSLLRKLSNEVHKITNFDIEHISDRLGNIIISLPVTSVSCAIQGVSNTLDEIIIRPVWAQGVKPRKLIITAHKKKDGMISQQIIFEESESFKIKNNENRDQKISIFDSENNVVLYALEVSIMREFNVSVYTTLPQERKVVHSGNEISLSVCSRVHVETGYEEPKALNDRLRERLYEESARQLHDELKLVQYNPGRANIQGQVLNEQESRDIALANLRKLINDFGQKSVYLWDPFLSAEDIILTLFYNRNYGSRMRAITRGDLIKKDSTPCTSRTSRQHDWANQLSQACKNPCGLFLEFRSMLNCKYGDFHDRFLMFPDVKPEPLVWSLGTSVNSVGKCHHILFRIPYGQIIVDTFEAMWEEINTPKHLIWKIPN